MKSITSRDREIIKYVEKYGFVTIGQAYQIWFNNRNYGYDVARKRLSACVENGYLNTVRNFDSATTENIYFIDRKNSHVSKHSLLIMDIYAKLSRIGANIHYFKKEQTWVKGRFRSDAFIIFSVGEYLFPVFAEVLYKGTTNNKSLSNIQKDILEKYSFIYGAEEYKDIINSTCKVQSDIKPSLLIIDELSTQEDWNDLARNYKIDVVDFGMDDICKILIC